MPKEKVRFVKYGKQGKKDSKAGDWISLSGSKIKDMNKKKAERKQKKGKGYIADNEHYYGVQLKRQNPKTLDSPAKMSDDLSYGGSVIDQEPGALSHMGASKVLKHMKSRH
jgi:hypothetical protein